MAINIHFTYTAHVTIHFYSNDEMTFYYDNCGSLEDIAANMAEEMVKHNFVGADACDRETGEVLIMIDRT